MKKLLTILCLVLLVSCSNEVPSDKLVERNGIVYEINSTKLFTGSSVSYYENGQVEIRLNFKNGKKEGLYEVFYDNGQLEHRGNYKNGEVDDGPYETYYENGQLFYRGNYKNGELDGLHESFRENGQLMIRENYKNGEREGISESYDSDGREYIFSPQCYKNDKEVDMSYCDN